MPQLEATRQPEAGPEQTPGAQPEQPEGEPAGTTPPEEPTDPIPQEQLPGLAIVAVSAGEGDGTLHFAVSLSGASGEPARAWRMGPMTARPRRGSTISPCEAG